MSDEPQNPDPNEPTPGPENQAGDSAQDASPAQGATPPEGTDSASNQRSPQPDSAAETTAAANKTAEEGAVNQDDIDALTNAAGASSPAEGETPQSAPQEKSSEFIQTDIDAAMAGAAAAAPPPADAASPRTKSASQSPQDDIDAMVEAAESATQTALDSAGRPMDDAAAAMAEALGTESATQNAPPTPQSFELPDFSTHSSGHQAHDISILRDVNLRVHIELGRTRMFVEDVLKLTEGSVVELDNLAGDPVDVIVNGRLVARGEVLVLSDNFCVRVNEIITEPQNVAVA